VRKRFVIAAFCIFALPLVFSPSQNESLSHSASFSTVAFAGHNNVGGKCDCHESGCECDPGEQAHSRVAPSLGASSSREGVNQSNAPGVDLGSGILTLALVALLWLRMR
jgi:hypothetical protein